MKKILIQLTVISLLIIISFLVFGELETFFLGWLELLRNSPLEYSLASFLILVSDILLPVPSSFVLYLNGVVLGFMGGFLVSILSATGFSITGYFIGKHSSRALRGKSDVYSRKILKKYGHFAIIITRGIPVLSESICLVCGYNAYNFKLYLLLNFIGYIPVCLIYAYFGSIAVSKNLFLLSVACSLAASLLLWLFGKKLITRFDRD